MAEGKEKNGMVWRYSGSFENYMASLGTNTTNLTSAVGKSTLNRREAGYWVTELSAKGIVSPGPILPGNFR